MTEPLLNLIGINKYFGDNHILKDISFDIMDGEFLTILGPSGCGKTTLIRCIAGLEHVNSGDILLRGKSIKDLPVNKRNINTVFQNYALFPHLNIYDNIAYGPRIKKIMEEAELESKITEMLQLVQMTGFEKRKVNQLSGGQKQRIALARALINEPDILLLDEPLGALDLKLRKHMQKELANLQKQTKTTFVYITHDQEEALNMSDRIVVMDNGVVQQLGSPLDIYNNPKNYFMADFIGDRNIIDVLLLEREDERFKIQLGDNIINIRCSSKARCEKEGGVQAILAVHMDKMKISPEESENSLLGKIKSIHCSGSQIRTEVDVDGNDMTIIAYQSNYDDYNIGDNVYITWDDYGAVLLPVEDQLENDYEEI